MVMLVDNYMSRQGQWRCVSVDTPPSLEIWFSPNLRWKNLCGYYRTSNLMAELNDGVEFFFEEIDSRYRFASHIIVCLLEIWDPAGRLMCEPSRASMQFGATRVHRRGAAAECYWWVSALSYAAFRSGGGACSSGTLNLRRHLGKNTWRSTWAVGSSIYRGGLQARKRFHSRFR